MWTRRLTAFSAGKLRIYIFVLFQPYKTGTLLCPAICPTKLPCSDKTDLLTALKSARSCLLNKDIIQSGLVQKSDPVQSFYNDIYQSRFSLT